MILGSGALSARGLHAVSRLLELRMGSDSTAVVYSLFLHVSLRVLLRTGVQSCSRGLFLILFRAVLIEGFFCLKFPDFSSRYFVYFHTPFFPNCFSKYWNAKKRSKYISCFSCFSCFSWKEEKRKIWGGKNVR